jgi:hypothetical protein
MKGINMQNFSACTESGVIKRIADRGGSIMDYPELATSIHRRTTTPFPTRGKDKDPAFDTDAGKRARVDSKPLKETRADEDTVAAVDIKPFIVPRTKWKKRPKQNEFGDYEGADDLEPTMRPAAGKAPHASLPPHSPIAMMTREPDEAVDENISPLEHHLSEMAKAESDFDDADDAETRRECLERQAFHAAKALECYNAENAPTVAAHGGRSHRRPDDLLSKTARAFTLGLGSRGFSLASGGRMFSASVPPHSSSPLDNI